MDSTIEGCSQSHIYVCKICGKITNLLTYTVNTDLDRGAMRASNLCFECKYWMDKVSKPSPNHYVINSQYFYFPPEVHAGERVRYILTHTGEVISSTEYYNYGYIPERFRELLPDNASFITKGMASFLRENATYVCKRKGCWDRRKCLWYQGPMDWNEIPEYHKEGAEMCPMYINALNPKKNVDA